MAFLRECASLQGEVAINGKVVVQFKRCVTINYQIVEYRTIGLDFAFAIGTAQLVASRLVDNSRTADQHFVIDFDFVTADATHFSACHIERASQNEVDRRSIE